MAEPLVDADALDPIMEASLSRELQELLRAMDSLPPAVKNLVGRNLQEHDAEKLPRAHTASLIEAPNFKGRLLVIDFRDSYTYNIVALCRLLGAVVDVVQVPYDFKWRRLDDLGESLETPECISFFTRISLGIAFAEWDGVILSPGPGHPNDYLRDFIFVFRLCRTHGIPIFGVCLGMQLMVHYFHNEYATNGHGHILLPVEKISKLSKPMHGVVNEVQRTSVADDAQAIPDVNTGLPKSFKVVCYHSLAGVVNDGDFSQSPMVVTSASLLHDRLIAMSIRARNVPMFAVQYHPESIESEWGTQILANFLDVVCRSFRQRDVLPRSLPTPPPINATTAAQHRHRLFVCRVELPESFEVESFFRGSVASRGLLPGELRTEWFLDNAAAPPCGRFCEAGSHQSSEYHSGGNFSYMGGGHLHRVFKDFVSGNIPKVSIRPPSSYVLQYNLETRTCSRVTLDDAATLFDATIIVGHDSYREEVLKDGDTFFCKMKDELATLQLDALDVCNESGDPLDFPLPFDFRGGFVGYLGYELEVESLYGIKSHGHSGRNLCAKGPGHPIVTPTAYQQFVTSALVLDHGAGHLYHLSLSIPTSTRFLESLLQQQVSAPSVDLDTTKCTLMSTHTPSQAPYEAKVSQCICHMLVGEAYELCLTTQHTGELIISNVQRPGNDITIPNCLCFDLFYTRLRKFNPAPYGCFMEVPYLDAESSNLSRAILSSSPERCIKISAQGMVEMKPIKGTLGIGSVYPDDRFKEQEFLRLDPKNRAENLMIVDLIRNDLNKICVGGSVHCPKLMHVETYKTVHQLVTTVRAQIDPRVDWSMDVIEAIFPGGSMTGAPKRVSCELLDDIENNIRRGIFSGSLGFISLNGASDLSIVIRTLCLSEQAECNGKTRSIQSEASLPLLPVSLATHEIKSQEVKFEYSLGAGGAVTVLSDPTDEYKEMCLKASRPLASLHVNTVAVPADTAFVNVALRPEPPPDLFTTMRATVSEDEDVSVPLLQGHHVRLMKAAKEMFGCNLPDEILELSAFAAFVGQEAHRYLQDRATTSPVNLPVALRVKVLLSKTSSLDVKPCIIAEVPQYLSVQEELPIATQLCLMPEVRVMMDTMASDTNSMAVFYKTTDRRIYDDAKARMLQANEGLPSREQFDDVLIWNKRGEVTESCIANIAVQLSEDKWITPPVSCGLLPGVMRTSLLAKTKMGPSLGIQIITLLDLKRLVMKEGKTLLGFNALRGIYRMKLCG